MLGISFESASAEPQKRSYPAPVISVVVPTYNEERNIGPMKDRLKSTMEAMDLPFEVIFVDDGSTDQSLTLLEQFAGTDSRFKIVSFSRNFGHQVAVTAGLEYARGEAVVVIDADLQDPPELIQDLVNRWQQGFDVIYAVRRSREGETWFKLITARIFYRFLRALTPFDIPLDAGDFRLMSRRVVQAFLSMPERERYIRGMIAWIGFRQTGVFYDRDERVHGQTKYTLGKMLRFAADGLTSFSYVPLQLASYVGFLSALIGFFLMMIAIYQKLFSSLTIKGWTSTVVITLFLGGIQLIMIGVLGEYVGRIHSELKRRPLYIVSKVINVE